jgi:hypothetical protein
VSAWSSTAESFSVRDLRRDSSVVAMNNKPFLRGVVVEWRE